MINYFTDPVLRAPTIGCMLMCLSASLVGVFAVLRKQSLLGEALSHAAYPGVMLGVLAAAYFEEADFSLLILAGAFLSSIFGVYVIRFLESRCKIQSDAALCFLLSVFFGVGVTLASRLQFTHTTMYQKSLIYLYGQAATMTDKHIIIYGILSLIIFQVVIFFFKELKVICFDRQYGKTLGIPVKGIESIFFSLIVVAIIVGMRSVGVVLISAMLIAPVVAARQYTHHLKTIFCLAGFFALLSGYFGNYLSVELSSLGSGARLVLPTGPMIVMVATGICLFSILFAPEKGLLIRLFRIYRFRNRCIGENLLKTLWRDKCGMTKEQLAESYKGWLSYHLFRLKQSGFIYIDENRCYQLTKDGKIRGRKIVRLHRLWEVYLVNDLGFQVEKVHRNAEEMEHIITPDLEKELTKLLKNPIEDPHRQPIPPREVL